MIGRLIKIATAALAAKKAYDAYKERKMVHDVARDIQPQAEGTEGKPSRRSSGRRGTRGRKSDAPSA